MIEVSDLHKSFGDLEVLRGIDLAVEAGEVVCVIGPSGSGKSTLLRCVNLLEQPTSGTVTVDGVELTDPECDIDAVRRRIGMVFQQFNLFPHLSVLGNVTDRPAQGAAPAHRGGRAGSPATTSNASASATRSTPIRRSCPAASSSGSRSPARWPWARR